MTISLTPELDRFVHRQVASGRFASSSEVIRAGLRLLEDQEREKETKREVLRAWLRESLGEHGPNLSEDEILEAIRARRRRVRSTTGPKAANSR
ncbi:MAG: antitoxin ParD1/3/4 [Candidatus Eremiobacteraeota bacterium]|jgi:antitoxin ParD1/3/4|nr:antitoxin ParD1/3/4 [Candidatus Eremiobacteraeota bacterium]